MPTVLVAGIAGASLGTEIAKALRLAGEYRVIGCDISGQAYGHYDGNFDQTKIVRPESYIDDLLELCVESGVEVVIPGAEQPTHLIAASAERFSSIGVKLAINSPGLISTLGNKERCFTHLKECGIEVPFTTGVNRDTDFNALPYPCVVKPSTDSGGSSFVFFSRNAREAELYSSYLLDNGKRPIVQEYVPHDAGEFTVGVLSDPDKAVRGAIALRRTYPSKLSVAARGGDFLISSGISQGHIGEYTEVCATARQIASVLGSAGPINIQGRMNEDGKFFPFEINPRFSATTYLRALAGFNEVDHFVKLLLGLAAAPLEIRTGWYFRSLSEVVVDDKAMRA